jgi:HlyD family secretion protein
MKNKRPIAIVTVSIAIVVILWLGMFRDRVDEGKMYASGTVEATESQLGFLATGRIESIAVREGDVVRSGEELAFLGRAEAKARHRQALAQVDAAQAMLAELESGARPEEIAQASAANDAASEQLNDARRDYERAKRLFDGGAISKEALDKARTGLDVAQSRYTQAQEGLKQLETGPRRERIEAQKAALAQAEANVAAVEAVLSNMVVRAPFDGIVSVRHREPGETVPAGSPVLTIQDRSDRWVRIYIPEQRIGAVHQGSPAAITTDTFEDKSYSGVVTYIASEAEFTPKTVQTTEERVRLVYAVKVRITGDEDYDLKPGIPADVELDLE